MCLRVYVRICSCLRAVLRVCTDEHCMAALRVVQGTRNTHRHTPVHVYLQSFHMVVLALSYALLTSRTLVLAARDSWWLGLPSRSCTCVCVHVHACTHAHMHACVIDTRRRIDIHPSITQSTRPNAPRALSCVTSRRPPPARRTWSCPQATPPRRRSTSSCEHRSTGGICSGARAGAQPVSGRRQPARCCAPTRLFPRGEAPSSVRQARTSAPLGRCANKNSRRPTFSVKRCSLLGFPVIGAKLLLNIWFSYWIAYRSPKVIVAQAGERFWHQ